MTRRTGERGIYPISSGVWRVQVAAGIDVARTAREGRPVYRTVERRFRGTLTEARRFRSQLATEVHQGRYGGTEATMADLAEAWLRELERIGRAPSTIRGYRKDMNVHVLPIFGRMKLRTITVRMISDHLGALSESGKAPNTVRLVHAALSSAFAQAVRWEWVESNPMSKVRAPSLANKRPKVPTVEEVAALLSAAGSSERPEMQRVIWLSATTGIRRGELCALRVADFDLDVGCMNVERAMSDGKVWTTKNRRWRAVALDPLTVGVVRAQIDHLEKGAAGAGVGVVPDAFLFSERPDGATPLPADVVSSFFARLTGRLGLHHITFHQLRKFMESRALDAGFSIAEVAHRAGHDPAVLMRFYAGSVDESGQAMGAAVASLLSPAGQ